MIKTVILTGKEVRVDDVGGFYAYVNNLSDDVIYASNRPNIVVGADGVAEIPAGAVKLITTKKGAVYLFGVGKVELSGQDHEGLDCSPSVTAVSSGTGDVTKAYVDAQDALNLEESRSYTDSALEAITESVEQKLTAHADEISALKDEKADRSDIPTSLPADGGNAETVNGHTVNADVPADAKFTDTTYTDMVGATESAEGISGLVPAPPSGNIQSYLRSDGSWDDPLKAVSNPNLLDNWYFADPINQRGATQYTGTTYTIDRWRSSNSHGIVETDSEGIRLSTDGEGAAYLRQDSEMTFPVGTELTFSVLVNSSASGFIRVKYDTNDHSSEREEYYEYRFSSSFDWQLLKVTATVTDPTVHPQVIIANNNDGDVTIKAAKLEYGNRQTLAREENGNWVLNDAPPNKASELAKCRQYQLQLIDRDSKSTEGSQSLIYAIGRNTHYLYAVVPIPTPLIKLPTISHSSNFFVTPDGSGSKAIAVTNIALQEFANYSVMLRIEVSNTDTIENGKMYIVYADTSKNQASLLLDANF